jgi:arsenite methyltransferase
LPACQADLLDRLGLRGDERILDLGCVRGAVLLAAQHLTTGRAVGVDLWRSRDQSGLARKNAPIGAGHSFIVSRFNLRYRGSLRAGRRTPARSSPR